MGTEVGRRQDTARRDRRDGWQRSVAVLLVLLVLVCGRVCVREDDERVLCEVMCVTR